MNPLGMICLIALDETSGISPARLRQAFASIFPRASLMIETLPADVEDQAFTMTVDNNVYGVALFRGSMPLAEYTHAAEASLFWRDAADAIPKQHAFIAIAGAVRQDHHGLARAQSVGMTQLAAALCDVLPATGVLWHSAKTISAPETVGRAARNLSKNEWPVDLWVGWRSIGEIGDSTSTVGFQTVGATEYLGFELQVPAFKVEDVTEPLRILYCATAYLMAYGDTIRDGQIVEVKGQRRVRYQLHLGPEGKPALARLSVLDTDHRKLH